MRRVRGGRIDVCSLDRKTPGNAWPRSKTDTILTSEFETRLEVGLSRGIEISLSKIDCNNLQRGPSFCNPSKGKKISNDQRYAAHEAMLRGLWPFRPRGGAEADRKAVNLFNVSWQPKPCRCLGCGGTWGGTDPRGQTGPHFSVENPTRP